MDAVAVAHQASPIDRHINKAKMEVIEEDVVADKKERRQKHVPQIIPSL